MKIASYDVHLLNLGSFLVDGGAMFGVVPKSIWGRSYPADEKNRIKIVMKSPLLISDERIILIDSGTGNKHTDKLKRNYEFDDSFGILNESLTALGLKRDDVTDVILTHLHFDHCGGCTYNDEGNLKPTFPNAKYYVQKTQFEWAKNPSEKDKAGYFSENYIPLYENGSLILLDGDVDLFPNVSIYKVNGHTYGMQLVGMYDENIRLLYASDLIPLANHVHLPFIMSYDLLPLITLEEKKLFLEECFENDVMFILQHDFYTDVIKIDKNEKGFIVKERYKWSDLK
jgi:glyoxylase-like metal-dependent hydrolase (beta-lactamase superfamily II)